MFTMFKPEADATRAILRREYRDAVIDAAMQLRNNLYWQGRVLCGPIQGQDSHGAFPWDGLPWELLCAEAAEFGFYLHRTILAQGDVVSEWLLLLRHPDPVSFTQLGVISEHQNT